MHKYLKIGLIIMITNITSNIIAKTYNYHPNKKLQVALSKTGLNRISNLPYKIHQIIGDESQFRVKHDEDGSNIYIMPLIGVEQAFDISIINDAGLVQDIRCMVVEGDGRIIQIVNKDNRKERNARKALIRRMFHAMKNDKEDIFYVRDAQIVFGGQAVKISQTKTYKYENIRGGVFELYNDSEKLNFKVTDFTKQFRNIVSYYPRVMFLKPGEKERIFIIQEIQE
jgi:hypothetical protein